MDDNKGKPFYMPLEHMELMFATETSNDDIPAKDKNEDATPEEEERVAVAAAIITAQKNHLMDGFLLFNQHCQVVPLEESPFYKLSLLGLDQEFAKKLPDIEVTLSLTDNSTKVVVTGSDALFAAAVCRNHFSELPYFIYMHTGT